MDKLEEFKPGKRIIGIEEAIDKIVEHVRAADVDTVERIFAEEFGYEVESDLSTENLICVPGPMCGGLLNEKDFLMGAQVELPEPNETDGHSFSFVGTVVGVKGEFGSEILTVTDQDDNTYDIEANRVSQV